MSSPKVEQATRVSTSSEPAGKPTRKHSKKWRVILTILALLLAYALFDLYGPRSSRMRSFDANEVARLETAMWKSYYSRERFKLYNQMTELLRTQYNLPFIRSNTVAYQASRAAFVFKDGHNRQEYEKALPYLVDFYSSVRKVSDVPFDVDRTARLELEWWIIHRERKSHAPGDLDRALADLPAEIYGVPAERLMEHAKLRAEAMTIRDNKAEQGGVTDADWAKIDELLHASWQSLRKAVND
ncbi:MAG TPA: hypothetical protein VJX74_18085 [Blastocatellia bacterium]|nr:hypothetical protein [Blastocatellia bacterium]